MREVGDEHRGGERRERLEGVHVRALRPLAPPLELRLLIARVGVVVTARHLALGGGDEHPGYPDQEPRGEHADERHGHGDDVRGGAR